MFYVPPVWGVVAAVAGVMLLALHAILNVPATYEGKVTDQVRRKPARRGKASQ
jgi:Na+/melibiose symporter-like transporter